VPKGIRELLRTLDLNNEVEKLRGELETTGSEAKVKKFSKRLKVLEASRSPASSPNG
jgi:DNA-directed RNA polymerase subunit beta'